MTAFDPDSYQIVQIITIVNQLHRLTQTTDGALCPPGMTMSQLMCVAFIAFQKDADVYQKDIETCFKLRRSTVSSLLNTLERKELIRRDPVPHDARLKKLTLTEEGRRVAEYVQDTVARLNQQLVWDLDPGERETLSRLLSRIQAGLAERCP